MDLRLPNKCGFWLVIFLIFVFLDASTGMTLSDPEYPCPLPPKCTEKRPRNSINIEKPRNSSQLLKLEKIAKALWDAKDYKIMSMIVRKSLHIVVHNCTPYLYGKEHEKFPITMFLPQDKAVRFEDWIHFDYQIVFEAITPQDDYRPRGYFPRLHTCDRSSFGYRVGVPLFPTQVSKIDGRIITLNNVKIRDWNIYNDGLIRVHGVDDFFELTDTLAYDYGS